MRDVWFRIDLTLRQKLMIDWRIACPEAGYPASEALYSSVEEAENLNNCLGKFEYELSVYTAASDPIGEGDE